MWYNRIMGVGVSQRIQKILIGAQQDHEYMRVTRLEQLIPAGIVSDVPTVLTSP